MKLNTIKVTISHACFHNFENIFSHLVSRMYYFTATHGSSRALNESGTDLVSTPKATVGLTTNVKG